MTSREDIISAFVEQWLRKAESDLAAAQVLLEADSTDYCACAFHCQQAVEKAIKAYLVRRQIEFRKTHDLEHLLSLLGAAEPGLQHELMPCAWLTPYGIEFRYPGEYPEVGRATARKALTEARRVVQAIRRRMIATDRRA